MSVMQVGIIGVVGAVLAVQLKGTKAEYAVYISVAAGILLLSFIAGRLEVFVQAVEQAASYVNILRLPIYHDADDRNYVYRGIFIRNLQGRRVSDAGRSD